MRKHTQEEIIQKFIKVHGTRYNYSKVKYINNYTKVNIICKEHGEFLQIPVNHLSGQGCFTCSVNDKFLTQEEFIEKAKEVHDDKYDYSKTEYIDSITKIIIICPTHGEFEQKAIYHTQGYGCEKCGGKFKISIKEFIQRATLIHGDRYDYSKSIYINDNTKINIICKKKNHGEFIQLPTNHLRGIGCPICKSSKGELAIIDILHKYNIKKIKEYRIPEIANELYYDFYLPEYNLLIEFHGKQHYEWIPFFNKTEDEFLARKNVDDIKKDNAYIFKYRLLEFNYKQLKELTKEKFEELVISRIGKPKYLETKPLLLAFEDHNFH